MNVPRPPDFRSLPRRCGRTSVSRRSSGNRRGEHHPCPPPVAQWRSGPYAPDPDSARGRRHRAGGPQHGTRADGGRPPPAGRGGQPYGARTPVGPLRDRRSRRTGRPLRPHPHPLRRGRGHRRAHYRGRRRTGRHSGRPPPQAPPGPSTPCVPLEARLDGSTGPVRLLPAAGIKDAVVVRRWGRRPFRSASRLVRPSSWPLGGTAGPAGCSGCSIP
jgi:hypothetical protein